MWEQTRELYSGVSNLCQIYQLPPSFDPVKSQILASKELPSLNEVFNCLRQASLSNTSNNVIAHSSDQSALLTTAGGQCNRGHGSRDLGGQAQGGSRGRGKGLLVNVLIVGVNIVEFCSLWETYSTSS